MKTADLIVKNANILTLDGENQRAGSLAVADERITDIWPASEPPPKEVKQTQETAIIDLHGATLIPGFIDTHNHILMHSQRLQQANCGTPPNKNIPDLLECIRLKAEEKPHGEWVQGYAYDDTLLEEQRHPTRWELDEVSPNHPVFVNHISSHLGAANSKALELAGLNDQTPDPAGGHLGRTSDGHLNGVLFENPAMDLIQDVIPKPTVEELMALLQEGARDYLREGITTNSDAAVGLTFGEMELDVHLRAAEQGMNPMRSQLLMLHTLLRTGAQFGDYTAEQLDQEIQQRSNGKAKLDSAKMFQDGSIQGLTGALRDPYYNDPGVVGDLFHDQQDFNEEILNLHKRGFRIAIHGNGDRAIGSILDGYAYALEQEPREEHRHRIEHVQTATTEDLDRMKELGVAGSVFINHVYFWGDRHKRLFLGPDRARRISPLAEIANRDILFALHSDCPVTPISPLFSIWAAVNRKTREGETLGEEQRIGVTEALKSMTIYGAEFIFDEANLGSIEEGKQADFAVLDADPTTVDPMTIKDIAVLKTIIGGDVVFDKQND